jgi:hypothetical protein
MRQLVVLLCVLGVVAAVASADSITTRVDTYLVNDPTNPPTNQSMKPVTVTDYLFELENFAAGVIYGPGESVSTTLGDLIPVCSNCHSMLHRTSPPMLPNELREIVGKSDQVSSRSSR